MTDLLAQTSDSLPATQGETALMNVIARAASDPTVDVDKLERIMALYERVKAKEAEAAYNSDLAILQPKLHAITERGGIKNNAGAVQSTYAKWEDINDVIKPILAEHGFSLSHRVGRTLEGQVTIKGVLAHRLGHREETEITLPVDSSGSKNAVQAIGSSTSYGQRYTAKMLLNITSRGEDDDGRAGGDRGGSAAVQAAVTAINMCTDLEGLKAWKAMNAEALKTLPSADQDIVVRHFNTRYRKMKGGDAE